MPLYTDEHLAAIPASAKAKIVDWCNEALEKIGAPEDEEDIVAFALVDEDNESRDIRLCHILDWIAAYHFMRAIPEDEDIMAEAVKEGLLDGLSALLAGEKERERLDVEIKQIIHRNTFHVVMHRVFQLGIAYALNYGLGNGPNPLDDLTPEDMTVDFGELNGEIDEVDDDDDEEVDK